MKFILIASAVFLCSCSTISYVEPKTGDRSRVRLVTDSESITVVRGYNNADCDGEYEMMRLRDGFLVNSSPKSLGMPLGDHHKNAAKEFYFKSNRDHYLMFFGAETIGSNTYTCAVPVSLKLESNKDYELSYNSGLSSCSAVLYEITKNEDEYNKNPINTFVNAGGEGCSEALYKSRWY